MKHVMYPRAANNKLKAAERSEWLDKRSSRLSRIGMASKLWAFIKGSHGAWYPKGMEHRVAGGIDHRRQADRKKTQSKQKRGKNEGGSQLGAGSRNPGGSSLPNSSIRGTPATSEVANAAAKVVSSADTSSKRRKKTLMMGNELPATARAHRSAHSANSESSEGTESEENDSSDDEEEEEEKAAQAGRRALEAWFKGHLEILRFTLPGSAEGGDRNVGKRPPGSSAHDDGGGDGGGASKNSMHAAERRRPKHTRKASVAVGVSDKKQPHQVHDARTDHHHHRNNNNNNNSINSSDDDSDDRGSHGSSRGAVQGLHDEKRKKLKTGMNPSSALPKPAPRRVTSLVEADLFGDAASLSPMSSRPVSFSKQESKSLALALPHNALPPLHPSSQHVATASVRVPAATSAFPNSHVTLATGQERVVPAAGSMKPVLKHRLAQQMDVESNDSTPRPQPDSPMVNGRKEGGAGHPSVV
jgi:hypothetical protein